MNNKDIREIAKQNSIYLWQVADKLGMNDSNFSKLLRKELPQDKKNEIFAIISSLKAGE